LHRRIENNDRNKLARKIMWVAPMKPKPINVDFKFDRDVCCLLDLVKAEACNRLYGCPMGEDVVSPLSSHHSQESDSSYCSPKDDPLESDLEIYSESDD